MKLYQFLKSKIYILLKLGFNFSFSFFCYLKLYDLTFVFVRLFIKTYYKNPQNNKAILIIRKSAGFEDTIKSLPTNKLSFNVYVIPRFILKKFFLYYLGSEYFKDKKYYKKNFFNNLNYLEYKKFISKFSKNLITYYDINLILNYNIMYKEVHALAEVSESNNIKFLTLQKEYIFSNARFDVLKNIYKKHILSFRNTYIATYNSLHKYCLISSGLAKKQNIYVVGCPRLDFSHDMRKKIDEHEKKKIVYFSIHKNAGLPIYDGQFNTYKANKDKKFNWLKLKKRTEKILSRFIKKNQNIDFIIKSKTGIEDNFDKFSKFQNNIKFIKGSLGHKLLHTAYLTIAFNSTTIFESIASGTPVIIPFHKMTKIQKKYVMSLPKTNLIKVVTNDNQFSSYLKMKKKKFSKKLKYNEKKILKKYMGNDDGKSGLRFYKLLLKLVN